MKRHTYGIAAIVVLLTFGIAFAEYKFIAGPTDLDGTIGDDGQSFRVGYINSIVGEGATSDAYETTIAFTDPTADATVTIPNATGTVALTAGAGSLKASETVTATNVLTAAECGTTYYLNSATEFATTLPAISTVSAGCTFKFFVVGAPSGASYTIITGNSLENVITGGAVERETDTNDDGPYLADADTITIVDGVAVAGDYLQFESDGSDFYMTGQVNADGAVTVTQAD